MVALTWVVLDLDPDPEPPVYIGQMTKISGDGGTSVGFPSQPKENIAHCGVRAGNSSREECRDNWDKHSSSSWGTCLCCCDPDFDICCMKQSRLVCFLCFVMCFRTLDDFFIIDMGTHLTDASTNGGRLQNCRASFLNLATSSEIPKV